MKRSDKEQLISTLLFPWRYFVSPNSVWQYGRFTLLTRREAAFDILGYG